jgi:hypothetical protein
MGTAQLQNERPTDGSTLIVRTIALSIVTREPCREETCFEGGFGWHVIVSVYRYV